MNIQPISYQSTYSQQIYLNSANAQIQLNGTKKSNVTFFFNDVITISKDAIEMRMELVNAQIPVSWYLINSSNNQFATSTNNDATFITWTLPVGNYNANTFISMFQTYMGSAFTITFNSTLNTFALVYNTGAWSIQDVGCNSIFSIIGFQSGLRYHSIGTTIQTPFSVNFGASFNLANIDSKANGTVSTISSVPISTIQGGYIFFTTILQISKAYFVIMKCQV